MWYIVYNLFTSVECIACMYIDCDVFENVAFTGYHRQSKVSVHVLGITAEGTLRCFSPASAQNVLHFYSLDDVVIGIILHVLIVFSKLESLFLMDLKHAS